MPSARRSMQALDRQFKKSGYEPISNKRILITAGTNGIGVAGAKRIAAEGGEVIVTGTSEEQIKEAIRVLPSSAVVIRNDAADPESAKELAEIVATTDGFDGFWPIAGFADVAGIHEIDAGFFDRMVNLNLRAPMLQLARLEQCLHCNASVLVTSSTAAYEGAPMATTCAATKGALIAITRGWSSALGGRQIRVNALVPGAISTSFRDFMD